MAVKQSSAEKRHRQSEERRMRNKAAKSSARTSARKFIEAVHAKDSALASERLQALVKEQKYEDRAFKSDSIEQIVLQLPSIFSKDDIRTKMPNVSLSTINRVLVKLRDEGFIKPLGTGRSAKWIKTSENNTLEGMFGDDYED